MSKGDVAGFSAIIGFLLAMVVFICGMYFREADMIADGWEKVRTVHPQIIPEPRDCKCF